MITYPFRAACLTIGIPAVSSCQLIYGVLLLLFLIAFSIYDIQYKRVPNAALVYFLPIVLLSLPVNLISSSSFLLNIGLESLLGTFLGGGTLLFAAMTTNGGIGGGDIKLTAMMGFVYGPYGILFALFCAVPLAMIFGFYERQRTGYRFFSLPFVPFLTIGCCMVTILKFYQ